MRVKIQWRYRKNAIGTSTPCSGGSHLNWNPGENTPEGKKQKVTKGEERGHRSEPGGASRVQVGPREPKKGRQGRKHNAKKKGGQNGGQIQNYFAHRTKKRSNVEGGSRELTGEKALNE